MNAAPPASSIVPSRRPRSFLRHVGRTALFNTVAMGASSVGGFLLAIALPAHTRGEYAAVQSWFSMCLVLGEMGIPAALTYYAAREPSERGGYLRSAQYMMVVSGIVTSVIGLVLVHTLARGDGVLALGYAITFAFVPCALVLGTYTFVLQATSIERWNIARLLQPGLYAFGIAFLVAFHGAGLLSAVTILVVSCVVQGVIAIRLARLRRERMAPEAAQRRRLLRFGLVSLLGNGAALVNLRIDQVVLSTFAALNGLGQYAVAVSISTLVLPVVAALGQVGLPRLARAANTGEDVPALVTRVQVLGPATAVLLAVPLYVGSLWLVPHLLRPDYAEVPRLVLLLLPGAVGLAAGNALGDVLRGLGRPHLVAWAQGGGVVLTVVGLVSLVPSHGVTGAAIVSSVAYCVVWVVESIAVQVVVARRRTAQGDS
jgi:stage V sporulation protein B